MRIDLNKNSKHHRLRLLGDAARVANRGIYSGTDEESRTAKKSDSDVSDDSDDEVD
jgi:hypothetical protein